MYRLTPFCTKTNLRENRFFATGGLLVGKNGTHNVKIYTEKWTKIKIDKLTSERVDKVTR